MSMSRRDFTMLAEWAGKEEAQLIESFGTASKGGFAPDSLIKSLGRQLVGHGDVNFKADKFVRHAIVERELWLEGFKEDRKA